MNNTKDTYLEQINKYYDRKLSSHALISLGITPELLKKFGAPDLPLVMQQSTLTKCIRKPTGSRSAHELSRNIIETLPEQINNPIFLVQDKERNSIALISDAKDKAGHSILIAIRMDERRKEMQVNEIKSIYGKTSLKEYLYRHMELKQLNVIDNEKAGMLSRVLGLQLPTTLTASSHNKNIASENPKVNHDFRSKKPQIQLLGKKKMVGIMKSQLGAFKDADVKEQNFEYTKFDQNSERLTYRDNQDNHHNLYHSVVGGKEVCLYNVNNGRNKAVAVPKDSILEKLNEFEKSLNKGKENTQPVKVNNLEHQRDSKER